MDVYEAVTSRRAVRGFTDEPVSREVLERVLSAAAWSPSGSNLQPWNTYVLTGAPLAELKKRAVERVANGDPWDEREYEMYPPALKSPYRERRSAFGKERYSALGIAREDWEARQRAAIANWDCFGAPAALFVYIDRDLGPAQWADLGMYLQTVMLLLRAEGIHSCPQMAWSQVRETVAEVLSPPEGLMLFCGMSIGYEDPTVSYTRTGRAPLDETVTFVDDEALASSEGRLMTADAPRQPIAPRATDRPGDPSPFALGLLLRRAHWRAAAVMTEALRPLGIELRHFAVLLVLVNRGPTEQRDLVEATGSDKAGIMRVVDDLERKGLAVRKSVPGDRRVRAVEITPKGLELFDAAHMAAAPLAERLVSVLGPGQAEQLTDLLTRFTSPAE